MFDALVPYSFLFLVMLWLGWMLYGRRYKPRPLAQEYREAVLRSLQVFRDCGLLADGEVDEAMFLEIARHHAESDGEFAEAAGLLAAYADAHGPFENFHYRSFSHGTSREDQTAAFRKTLTTIPDRGRFAMLTFEGSFWNGGYVLTQMSDAEFERLSGSLDPEEAELRWLG